WVSDKEPEAPPYLDYVPSLEHPPSLDYVTSREHLSLPEYVPKPKYPKYLVPSDDEVPIEDHPLPADALPTALSPGYVVDFDLEEDPIEDPANYLANKKDVDDEEEEGEEEEHLAG
ncbi:hypothetical protein Tco_1397816, partial [Tanacetum coccineum]